MSTLRFENALRIAFGTSRHLAQAVAPDVPREAERRELGPHCGPVERSSGHLPGEEVSAVGGGPTAVCGLHQVGYHHVRVELGVPGPTGAVSERGADEAVGLDQLGSAMASTGEAGLVRELIDDRGDRPVMGHRDGVTNVGCSERP